MIPGPPSEGSEAGPRGAGGERGAENFPIPKVHRAEALKTGGEAFSFPTSR